MIVLSLNPGSSSLRFSLYDFAHNEPHLIIEGKEERIKGENGNAERYSTTVEEIFQKISSLKQLNGRKVEAIGCRVVHGGPKFFQPTVVKENTLQEIRALADLAPLHNDIDADVLEACIKAFQNIPIIAIFDTAFHHTLPQTSSTYALPQELSTKYNLKRYGFHGIAHQYVSEMLCKNLNKPPLGTRLITCHLGNGASICAIKDGKSIDTSMGLTPLEGLIMGTRSGDIDPGLILHLIKNCGITPSELENILYKKSGLLGISKISSDMRDIEKAAIAQNTDAKLALEMFTYRVSKYIGSYFVALGGVDAIAFSGGIGENSISILSKICESISCLGVALNLNVKTLDKSALCITTEKSPVGVWVIKADENLQISKQVFDFVMKENAT